MLFREKGGEKEGRGGGGGGEENARKRRKRKGGREGRRREGREADRNCHVITPSYQQRRSSFPFPSSYSS